MVWRFAFNRFEGAVACRDLLQHNNALTELDVSNSRINWEGAKFIAQGLRANSSLRVCLYKLAHNMQYNNFSFFSSALRMILVWVSPIAVVFYGIWITAVLVVFMMVNRNAAHWLLAACLHFAIPYFICCLLFYYRHCYLVRTHLPPLDVWIFWIL